MEKRKSFLSVKEMVEMALLVALAVVLDLDGFKISLSADGGSIGFTMVPLFILGYRHGFFKSLIGVGVIYGLTTALLDGHGLMYYPFDYLIAYGVSISIGSLFSKAIFYKGEFGSDKVLNILCLLFSYKHSLCCSTLRNFMEPTSLRGRIRLRFLWEFLSLIIL